MVHLNWKGGLSRRQPFVQQPLQDVQAGGTSKDVNLNIGMDDFPHPTDLSNFGRRKKCALQEANQAKEVCHE